MKLYKFPEIENLYQVIKNNNYLPKIRYRCKVKLHGTNAAVVITKDDIYCQSRKNCFKLSDNDKEHFGFVKFVNDNQHLFKNLQLEFNGLEAFIVYGEWCGPGIQKGVAISKIPEKTFCIFAVREVYNNGKDIIIVDPHDIQCCWSFKAWQQLKEIVKFIPYYNLELKLNLNDIENIKTMSSSIDNHITQIDKCDTFVYKNWSIEGQGEDLIFYPVSINNEKEKIEIDMDTFLHYTFVRNYNEIY